MQEIFKNSRFVCSVNPKIDKEAELKAIECLKYFLPTAYFKIFLSKVKIENWKEFKQVQLTNDKLKNHFLPYAKSIKDHYEDKSESFKKQMRPSSNTIQPNANKSGFKLQNPVKNEANDKSKLTGFFHKK